VDERAKIGEKVLREGTEHISPIVEDVYESSVNVWGGPITARLGATAATNAKISGVEILPQLLKNPGKALGGYGIENINAAISELGTLGVRGVDVWYKNATRVFEGGFPKGVSGPLNVIKSRIGEDYPSLLENLTARVSSAMGIKYEASALEEAFNALPNDLVIPFGNAKWKGEAIGPFLPSGLPRSQTFCLPSDLLPRRQMKVSITCR
jgi:hypothetical protein